MIRVIVSSHAGLDRVSPPRYHVGIEGPGFRKRRYLIHGPWCAATACHKASALEADLGANPAYAAVLARRYGPGGDLHHRAEVVE